MYKYFSFFPSNVLETLHSFSLALAYLLGWLTFFRHNTATILVKNHIVRASATSSAHFNARSVGSVGIIARGGAACATFVPDHRWHAAFFFWNTNAIRSNDKPINAKATGFAFFDAVNGILHNRFAVIAARRSAFIVILILSTDRFAWNDLRAAAVPWYFPIANIPILGFWGAVAFDSCAIRTFHFGGTASAFRYASITLVSKARILRRTINARAIRLAVWGAYVYGTSDSICLTNPYFPSRHFALDTTRTFFRTRNFYLTAQEPGRHGVTLAFFTRGTIDRAAIRWKAAGYTDITRGIVTLAEAILSFRRATYLAARTGSWFYGTVTKFGAALAFWDLT